ncbi:MAG: hypothetical protein GX833_04355 [Clostridium sp.]|jgi:hypothetical protein|nr:hypothetical protein [Clostridium sp.]
MKIKRKLMVILMFSLLVTACSGSGGLAPLPAPLASEDSSFGVDKNINMETIDNYLDREDVAYRDVRMLFDPADYAAVGGDADLSKTITGFKIVPYPYIGTLPELPVDGAYQDQTLFTVDWAPTGEILSAKPLFKESMMILKELFPQDQAIFIMCGGAGYSQMVKDLLIFLGWDETKLYNTGANWGYTGKNSLELIVYPEDANDDKIYALWRADYAQILFDKLNLIND